MELTDFELKKKNFFEKHNINPKKNRKKEEEEKWLIILAPTFTLTIAIL